MSQEISTEDGLLDVSNNEDPRQQSSEAEVEGEQSFAIRSNGSIVHGHECEFLWWTSVVSARGR